MADAVTSRKLIALVTKISVGLNADEFNQIIMVLDSAADRLLKESEIGNEQ